MAAHAAIKAASEKARALKVLGSSLQCSVILQVPDTASDSILKRYEAELESMFVVSSVELQSEPETSTAWAFPEAFNVNGGAKCIAWVLPPKQHKCIRCWRYVAIEPNPLCGRCEDVVANMDLKQWTDVVKQGELFVQQMSRKICTIEELLESLIENEQ
jgi:isoleucyl-tRNA synthetase